MTFVQRSLRLIKADDPETGWLVRIVLSMLLSWALFFLGPHDPGVRAVLAASLACWFLWVFGDRRWPRVAWGALALAALLPAAVAGLPDSAASMTFLFSALFTFVLLPRVPLWAILSLAGAVIAVLLTVLSLAGRGPTALLTQPVLIIVLLLFNLHRREYRLRAEQNALLLEQISRTQEAQAHAAALGERARIARELHDVLAHSLGALGVQLELAEAELTEKGDGPAAAAVIRRARRLARDGLAEARSAVAALRADVPPLSLAIGELVAGHRADHAAAATLRTEGAPRGLPSAAEVSLLRTAREALTNAARHAPGAPVTVILDYRGPAVRLTVENPAPPAGGIKEAGTKEVGGAKEASGAKEAGTEEAGGAEEAGLAGGYGLTGARERIALVGGTLEAGATGGAWRVIAEVPA